jgi:hypothetical protein
MGYVVTLHLYRASCNYFFSLGSGFAQVTAGLGITALSMALLASESELGILLLALRVTGKSKRVQAKGRN